MIELYRPSNGTEGDGFITSWCHGCARFDQNRCQILVRMFACDTDEPGYPAEWCFDDSGLPQCKAFIPVGELVPPTRCDRTVDMFGGAA